MLLIVSLGLDWYGEVSGFNSFEFLDLLLVLLALVTLAVLAAELGLLRTPLRDGHAARGRRDRARGRAEPAGEPSAGSAIDLDVETGLWLGLAGAALMLAGAILATARIAIAVEPRRAGTAASRRRRAAAGQLEAAGRSDPHGRGRASALTPQIAVVGSGEGDSPEAEAVGRGLAARGAVVVCGGLGGVMEAACRGAKEAGGHDRRHPAGDRSGGGEPLRGHRRSRPASARRATRSSCARPTR